jgi:DNA invertase Pin-like site-specific DNA recombinase
MGKWAAYARVSTGKQAASGLGLEDQRRKLLAWAEYNGHDVELFVDAGESGKNTNRPELQRALSAIRRREFDGLVVVKLDRLSRSVRDLLNLMDEFRHAGGPGFVSCEEALDTTTAMGRFVLVIFGALAQLERELIGERTSAALQVKAARGEYTGGRVPFGKRLADDGVTLLDDGALYAAAERANTLRVVGHSLRSIGAHLKVEGFKPPGKAWHTESVKRLLALAGVE